VISATEIHQLGSPRLKILAALSLMTGGQPSGASTPSEIANFLRDECRVSLSRQQILAILSKAIPSVAPRKIGGRLHYQLMKLGEDEIAKSARAAIFIEPKAV
jgi:hypothetical protein